MMLCAPVFSQTSDRDAKFRLAQGMEQAGDYERAAALYQDLLKTDPTNAVLFEGLQRAWMQLKRHDDVILLIRNRLALAPADVNLHALLGSVLYRSGREKEAAREWDAAIAVDPANPGVYRLVASVLTENRLLDQAADIYRRARGAIGDPSLFTLELAQLLSAMMDYGGAATEYVGWLRRNPTQLAFVQSRLSSWSARDDARTSASAVVRTAVREREDLALLELEGWLAMEGKDYDGALAVYRRADELARARGMSLYQFAERAFKEKAFDVAARAYREAINVPLNPQRMAQAEYGYAMARKEISGQADTSAIPPGNVASAGAQHRYADVVERFTKIIETYPGSEFALRSYYQIGLIQFEKFGDRDGALASFGQVLEGSPAAAPLRYDVTLQIGRVHVARGDTARAATHFAAVAASPDALPDQSDEAVFRLAELDCAAGRFDAAVHRLDGIMINLKADYANDALRLQMFLQENITDAPDALRRFAHAEFLARQGKNTEAIALFLDLVQVFPRAPLVDDAVMAAAMLQAEAGLFTEAIASLEKLLTQFKESSVALDRAQFRLAEIYQYGTRNAPNAIAAYEKLLAEHPSSLLSVQARKRIRQLRGDAF